jgi:hypothetical protein
MAMDATARGPPGNARCPIRSSKSAAGIVSTVGISAYLTLALIAR